MPGDGRVLVTGASGFLGRRLIEVLVDRGFPVQALVRETSNLESLRLAGVQFSFGDVSDIESLRPAFEGVDYVVHAAADTSGTEYGTRQVTIEGARNVLELCAIGDIRKLVYISSCSVYGVTDYESGQLIDERASLERFPGCRGIYSWGKCEAESLVTTSMLQGKVSAVCLRPGTIYGSGGENFSPLIGFSIGPHNFAVIGNGDLVLPLVYVDNLVEAVIAAMESEKTSGQIYNVVDFQQIDKKQYMDTLIRKLDPSARIVYLPFNLVSTAVVLQEKLFGLLNRKPLLTRYRLMSSQKPVRYDASKINKELGWRSTVSFDDAAERIIAYEKGRAGPAKETRSAQS
jgi:nucleoside-diphosphate-sugar epimerase